MSSNWFSNFVPYIVPLVECGITYHTPEHYYQASKSVLMSDRRHIASLDTPGQAKRAGKRVTLDVDWKFKRVFVMYKVIIWRLETDVVWREKLLSCPLPIVEVNKWHDMFWGKCICDKHNGHGKNMLGQILINLRMSIETAVGL